MTTIMAILAGIAAALIFFSVARLHAAVLRLIEAETIARAEAERMGEAREKHIAAAHQMYLAAQNYHEAKRQADAR